MPAGGAPEVEGKLARAEAPAAGATDGGEDAVRGPPPMPWAAWARSPPALGGGFLWYRRRLP